MSAVKRNALKREYEDEDPLDDEENEETLDEATSNCRRRTCLKMPSLLCTPQSLGNVTWKPLQERRCWMRPVRQLQKSSPAKLFVKKRRTREKCMVQDALAALYAAESRKRNSETAARAALLDAASAAVAEVVAGEALREA